MNLQDACVLGDGENYCNDEDKMFDDNFVKGHGDSFGDGQEYIVFLFETTMHYLLRCQLYSSQRLELLNGIYALIPSLKNDTKEILLQTILYGSEKVSFGINNKIITLTVRFLKKTHLFDQPLF